LLDKKIIVMGGTFGKMHANLIVKMVSMNNVMEFHIWHIWFGGLRTQIGVDSLGSFTRFYT